MSMIDCKVNVDKKPDPKGDRVVLTFEYVLCIRCHVRTLNASYDFQRQVFIVFEVVIRGLSAVHTRYKCMSSRN